MSVTKPRHDSRLALPGAAGRAPEVEVWRANLDGHADATVRWLESLLSADERERARGFFLDRDRRRFAVCRGILREILGRKLGRPAATLEFRYGTNGKPGLVMEDGAEPPIHFNVAHSGPLALCALTRDGAVGIDVERIRPMPDYEHVAQSAFAADELERLMACPPERRQEEFFHAWTRQEAVLKALGTGLGGVAPQDRRAAFAVYPLKVDDGYTAALALARTMGRPGEIAGWNPARHPQPVNADIREVNLT